MNVKKAVGSKQQCSQLLQLMYADGIDSYTSKAMT
jgi:hypothetical protein